MERKPCSNANSGNKSRPWSAEENEALKRYVDAHGPRRWREISCKAGLNRSPKSCRLRWLNYLRPGIKRGNISDDEEDLILRLHKLLGNRWSLIAGRLPGRTDSEIKNHWNYNMRKKILMEKVPGNQLQAQDNYDCSRGEPSNNNFKEVDDISGMEDEEEASVPNGYETEKIPSFSSLVVSDQLPQPKDSSAATFLMDLEMYLNDHDLQNSKDFDDDLQKWINQLCEDDGNLQQEESSSTALSFLADGTQELEDNIGNNRSSPAHTMTTE